MFLDSSALVALLALEDDARELAARMERHRVRTTSPVVVWEASIALSRILAVPAQTAHAHILRYLETQKVEIADVTSDASARAVAAWSRYGKGNHPAALNFGDCFSYAMAELARVPMLYKGADFAATDVTPA